MSLSFYASIATASLTLVLERKDGLLQRSLVSGVYPNEYILSHVITQTVVVIFQIILVLLMAFFIFHIPNRGPVFWISVLIVMQGVAGMAYGIMISAIAKEENFTLAACMGSMFPQFLLSGSFIIHWLIVILLDISNITQHTQVSYGQWIQCHSSWSMSVRSYRKPRQSMLFVICYIVDGIHSTIGMLPSVSSFQPRGQWSFFS